MTKVAEDILQGLRQALDHAQGRNVPGLVAHKVDVGTIDVRAVRQSLALTQVQMASLLGTSLSGYRKWEQGTRQPSGAARTLMIVMQKEPEAVQRALLG